MEKVQDLDRERGGAGYRTRYQSRDREKREGRCEEKWAGGARSGGGAKCRCKCKCEITGNNRTEENRWDAAKARNRNRNEEKSRGGMQSRRRAKNKGGQD